MGGASVNSGTHLNVRAFSESIQNYLRTSGHTQKELADAISLNPKVLSRKLKGTGTSHLTQLDVQHIITGLARWRVITTQDEATHLLEAAGLGAASFSEDEWQTPPLSTLTTKSVQPTLSSSPPALHNLPAPATRLIGREWAVTRLLTMLERDGVRLVTLFGVGGSGKTRLALHLASELVGSFEQGVWYVALAGINDATLVPTSIMQALHISSAPDLPPLQSLIAYLRNKNLLLVLDNVEQVGEVRAIVREILSAAPGLKVLTTSRVVLHVYGEYTLNVPPMDIPDLHASLKTEEIAQFEAIQLFTERAQAAASSFALTDENAAVIAQICARVDGLPLAVELAAARVRVLSPSLLLERLAQAPLRLLTGGAKDLPDRHRALRNTIAWSYDLLSPEEQLWFRRLGIFIGGWSIEAVEAMARDEATDQTAPFDSALDMLEQLVDSSLIVRTKGTDQQPRFTMLETLREYALEQLAAHGEIERLHDWHACYFLAEAEAGEIGLRGPQQLEWLARLATERDNFRSALQWLLPRGRDGMRVNPILFPVEQSNEAGTASKASPLGTTTPEPLAIELYLRLTAALRAYWEWQGQLTEGRDWLKAGLDLPLKDGVEQSVLAARAKALSETARLVCLQNSQERALELVDESISLWKQLNNNRGLAGAMLHRGWANHAKGDYEAAKSAYWEGMRLLSPADDPWLYAELGFHLAAAAGFTFDFEQMRSLYTESKALFEQAGDKSAVADLLKDQGGMSILESKYTEAIDCLLESINLCYGMNHMQFITTGIGWLSFAVGMKDDPTPEQASIRSARLGGAAEGLQEAIGLTPWAKTHPLVQAVRQYIRSKVGESDWNAAWAAGKALTLEQTIDLVNRLGAELPPAEQNRLD